jgi:hypothetical protein
MANMPGKRRPKRTFLKRLSESTPARVTGLVASIIGIFIWLGSMFHRPPAKPAALPVATTVQQLITQPTFQSSSGPESPNISNVSGSVDIRYESAPPASAKKGKETK